YPATLLHLSSFPTRRSSDLDRDIFFDDPVQQEALQEIIAFIDRTPNFQNKQAVLNLLRQLAAKGQIVYGRTPRGFRVQKVAKRRSEEHTSELQSLAYLVCRL